MSRSPLFAVEHDDTVEKYNELVESSLDIFSFIVYHKDRKI